MINPYVVIDILDREYTDEKVRIASRHRTEKGARDAAWRIARANVGRSQWSEIDDSEIDDLRHPTVRSVGHERDALAYYGRETELTAMVMADWWPAA